MLILLYWIFKNNYIVPNFNYGMLCYVTISTSSWYVFMIGFMGGKKIKMIVIYIHSVISGTGRDFFLLHSTQTCYVAQKYA